MSVDGRTNDPRMQYDEFLYDAVMNLAGADGSNTSFKAVISATDLTPEQELSLALSMDQLTDARDEHKIVATRTAQELITAVSAFKTPEAKEIIFTRMHEIACERSSYTTDTAPVMMEGIKGFFEQENFDLETAGRLSEVATLMLSSGTDNARQNAITFLQRYNKIKIENRSQGQTGDTVKEKPTLQPNT